MARIAEASARQLPSPSSAANNARLFHPQLTPDANHALHHASMSKKDRAVTTAAIARAVRLSTRYAWLVIPGFLLAAILSGGYISRHIAITTDSSKLLSSSLPWRQQETRLNQLFPQRTDRIIAVIDSTTAEAADEAAAAVVDALTLRSDVIRTIGSALSANAAW